MSGANRPFTIALFFRKNTASSRPLRHSRIPSAECQERLCVLPTSFLPRHIQPEDAEAIGILLELLHAPDDTVKWNAAVALRTSASSRTTFVIDALMETLVSNNHQLRRMVFLTLGAFGPPAAKAVPALEAALDSPDPRTRVVAEAALATIVPGRHRGLSVPQDPKSNQIVRTRLGFLVVSFVGD